MPRRTIHVLLTAALLALAVAARIADPAPLAMFRTHVFDTYLRLAPRAADPAFPVRIIDIDAASLTRLGQWPWPRTRLAELVDRLAKAGAKVIAFDMILPEPDRLSPASLAKLLAERLPDAAALADRAAALPSNDDILGQAIARAPVVLGVVGGGEASSPHPLAVRASFALAGDDPKPFLPRFGSASGSLDVIAAKAKGTGIANWLPSEDQLVRGVPLLAVIGGQLAPSLPLEALRVAGNHTTVFVRSSGASGAQAFGQKTGIESVRVGGAVLPTGADGQLWLRFAPVDPRRTISAHRVLDGSAPASDIAGRILLIGASAPGLMDLRATPLEASVPGVEVHAQALEQMLSGDHLVRPDFATGAELTFLVLVGALVGWLLWRSGPLTAALAGGAAIIGVGAASWLLYARSGYLLDPVYPSLALAAVYTATTLVNYARSEVDRTRVRTAFSHYMAPELVEELASHPDKLKLGGEMREVTLLFADVRGFSRLSEGMDAEDLTRFVNRLFTALTEAITAHRGTVDKYIGDAVMAYWNAPLADPEHAANACRAALAMGTALERLNRLTYAEGGLAGLAPGPVRIGVGLNTGLCCVGNLGSPQRFDYSIIGDPVNVAARLETATKAWGAPIIAGRSTVAAAKGFAFVELGTVTLPGKDRRETIHALVGDERYAATAEFGRFSAACRSLREAYATGDEAAVTRALPMAKSAAPAFLAPMLETLPLRLPEALAAALPAGPGARSGQQGSR